MAKLVEKHNHTCHRREVNNTPSQEHQTLLRLDIYQGAYTKDTKFLVSPFIGPLRHIKEVSYKAASQVIRLLNHQGANHAGIDVRSHQLLIFENNAHVYKTGGLYAFPVKSAVATPLCLPMWVDGSMR